MCYRDAKQGTKNVMRILCPTKVTFWLRRIQCCCCVLYFFSFSLSFSLLVFFFRLRTFSSFFFFATFNGTCVYFGHRLNNIISATQEAQYEHDEMHHRQMLYELTYSTKYVETITLFCVLLLCCVFFFLFLLCSFLSVFFSTLSIRLT